MIYNIPDDILPYLEYVPEEMLSDVISDALRALIFKKPEVKQEFDVNQIVEQLRGLSVEQKPEPKPQPQPQQETYVADVNIDEEIPDDLMDTVGDFTANLFK